jgi:acyl carrier protein
MTLDKKVEEIFASTFGISPDQLSDSLSPDDVKGWDSLGHLRLVTALSEEVGCDFEVQEIMEMENLAKIKEIVATHEVRQ